MVERMHGRIMVDSTEGHGTHFTVTVPLPMHEDSSPDQLPQAAKELVDTGVTLAIPADNPHRPAIERQLRAWQIPVWETGTEQRGILLTLIGKDGIESAVQAANWHGPGLILADSLGISAQGKSDNPILSLPLRRDELYRCLCRAAGIVDSDPALRSPDALEPEQTAQSLRILLVEDNQVNQLVASSILKKLGHTVESAENGQRALDAMAAGEFDLILMDCQMPIMDGYEATRRIRQNSDWQAVPIIAVTANVMQGDRDDCITAGMNDYVTKPFKREELRAAINRWTPPRPQEP
nr:response regulator [Marinobacter similis]